MAVVDPHDTSLDGADSINIIGKVSASSLLHGNGGNDTFTLGAEIYNSTIYGGQGADELRATTTSSITASHIAGNRGADKLIVAATTILNSTILGSDSTGTIAGNDSLSIGAATIQTSTVSVVQV